MKSKFFLIGTLFTFALPGLAAAQGTLRGTITNAATGAALEGASVSVADLNMGANTMAGGAYEITGIPAGTHEVEVRLIGFQLARREVTITEGGTARLDIALTVMAIELGGLVAVGSRARPRTVTESPVPVDVIRTRELVNQGDSDLVNLIRNVVPSWNANIQPISDAATFARPANLRGLAPDHTLVLVNGKRRHRTAVITWYGNGLADGSQGPDIAVIPGLALEQAEVLRDGASAQYGSDAIAGVMNFVLKNDRSGGAIEFKSGGYLMGETSERFEEGSVPGDGEMYTVSGNVGLPIGRDRLPEPDRRVRQRLPHGPQHAAQRRARTGRRRQLERPGARADLGLAPDLERDQAVGEYGLRIRQHVVLLPRQLREQAGRGRVLLP